MSNKTKTAMITGITGQDGAYLSKLLLGKGYKVYGILRTDEEENYFGLKYLNVFDRVTLNKCSLLNLNNIEKMIRDIQPDEIYNLAAQSSVGASFVNPHETVNFNVLSVLNLLESIKKINRGIRFYQASSSDMFGNIDRLPVSEKSIIHPTSPYGISKATGHWMTVNYRESYDLYACSGILFNHESYLRTTNFFVKKVIKSAINIKNGREKELRVGDIGLRRDFGYAPRYVEAIWLMLQQDKPKEFTICSGESISLEEIIHYVFDKIGVDKRLIVVDESLLRPNDIKNIYGSNEQAKKELGWKYDKTFFDVLDLLIKEELVNLK